HDLGVPSSVPLLNLSSRQAHPDDEDARNNVGKPEAESTASQEPRTKDKPQGKQNVEVSRRSRYLGPSDHRNRRDERTYEMAAVRCARLYWNAENIRRR